MAGVTMKLPLDGLTLVPADREGRVQYCLDIMRAGRWRRGASGDELAKHWEVNPSMMRSIAGEAWRRLHAEVLDRPRLQVFAVQKLEATVDDALAAAGEGGRDRAAERRNAISALGEILRFAAGVEAVTSNWEALSIEEKWLKIDEAQARIDSVRATLPPRDEGNNG